MYLAGSTPNALEPLPFAMTRSSKSFGSFFHGANGIKIEGGIFNEVHGNFTHFEDHRTIVSQAELGERRGFL